MFQSIVFSVLFVSLVAGAAVPVTQGNIKADLVLISDASQLNALKQGAELIPIERDCLVAQSSDSHQWTTATDVTLQFQYTGVGPSPIITFVELIINQSSNLGQAYVVEGGIGQRHIVIIVEAYNITLLSYSESIYGV